MQSERVGRKGSTSEALPPPERPTAAGRVLIKRRMKVLILPISAQRLMALPTSQLIGCPNYLRKNKALQQISHGSHLHSHSALLESIFCRKGTYTARNKER